ncbi:MAG TPA: putative Ig domain-containing protein [Pseudonocardiaceae bacterium]
MRVLPRSLIAVAALALSFGGLVGLAHAAPASSIGGVTQHSGGLKVDNYQEIWGEVVGTPAHTFQFTCSGGVPPCTWTATGLPPGLAVDSAGNVSGTPTTAGVFSFTVTARDTRNATASGSSSWYVYVALTEVNPGNQTGTVGTAVNPPQLRCFGGIPPCRWTVTGLPPGLGLTSNVLDGTPTTAGTFNVTVTATDTRTVTSPPVTFTWTINP